MKDPKAAIGPSFDPGFRVRSTIHPNRPVRDTGWEVEPATARFLGIAGLVAASVATTIGTSIIAIVRIQMKVLSFKQSVVV